MPKKIDLRPSAGVTRKRVPSIGRVHDYTREDSTGRRQLRLIRLILQGRRTHEWKGVTTHFVPQKDRPLNHTRAVRVVELFERLREMNRNKRLGLRLPPTMRVLEVEASRPQIVQTHYRNEIPISTLPRTGESPFYRDVVRQMEILLRHGYEVDLPAFIPVRAPGGDVHAILYHLALVQPKREREPVQDIHRREWKKKK